MLEAGDGARWEIFVFGSGAPSPWAAEGRAAAAPFFLCYNRADAALRTQDLLTAIAWLGGAVRRLEARGAAVVPAIVARAFAGTRIAALDLELGPEWADPDPEVPWLAPGHFLPGILRAGGAAGLLAMAAPADTRVRGTLPSGAERVGALYRDLGAEPRWLAPWGDPTPDAPRRPRD